MSGIRLSLSEWQTVKPERGSTLAGHGWGEDEITRRVAEDLTRSRRLEVLEMARGLEVRATSFVGRIRLGAVEITVHPKLTGAPLLNLFRYAYGLRDLHLYERVSYGHEQHSFQDLLIDQLGTEVQELLTRGLHRDYQIVTEALSSPRGRIDFSRYARSETMARTTLPCRHHPRSEDTVLNRILLAGLAFGAGLTTDPDLRARMWRLSKFMGAGIAAVTLDSEALEGAWRALDRRTAAYESALKLIELLLGDGGAALGEQSERLSLRGFLFDMNRFFQALISRFLKDNLPECEVHDERRLKGMFAYRAGHNPRGRRAPTPRPDFIVMRGTTTLAVLDAKYRDLWERTLPHSMLYQLAVYALGHPDCGGRAAILYPTMDPRAVEQSIAIRESHRVTNRAYVELRPVNLLALDELLRAGNGSEAWDRRKLLAHGLVFGEAEAVPQADIIGGIAPAMNARPGGGTREPTSNLRQRIPINGRAL